jgi:hypothetical protein
MIQAFEKYREINAYINRKIVSLLLNNGYPAEE